MKNKISQLAHDIERFWRNQSGVIAILSALLLVPVLSFVGMAVDFSRALGVRTEMQGALDAVKVMLQQFGIERIG